MYFIYLKYLNTISNDTIIMINANLRWKNLTLHTFICKKNLRLQEGERLKLSAFLDFKIQ